MNIPDARESLTAAFQLAAGDPFQSVLQRTETQRTIIREEAGSAQLALRVQRAPLLLQQVTFSEQAPLEAAEAEHSLPASAQLCLRPVCGGLSAPGKDVSDVVVPGSVIAETENALLMATGVE